MRGSVKRFFIAVLVIVGMMAGVSIVIAAPYAYIPNYSSNSVLVLDQQTNKIINTIPVGIDPRGVAVNSAGNRVYVTNISSDSVSVINGITQTVIGSPIGVGDGPRGIVVSPDNSFVYVANQYSNSISVIDALNNTVVHTITDVPCNTLAMHPSGDLLFAAGENPGELRVIDTASRSVVGTPIAFGNNLYGIAMNPTGTHIYIANYSNSVYVVRTADRNVTQVPVGEFTRYIAVHPSGAFVYAVGQISFDIYVIDAGTNMVVDSIDVNTTVGISFNSDGTRAYVLFGGGPPAMQVIDTATHAVIDTVEADNPFGAIYDSFVAPHRHVWNGTTSFPIKLTGLGADGKFVKSAGELTGRVIEMRTLGGTPESRYSLLFLSDDLKSSIYLPDVTFLMTDVNESKSEKFMMSGIGKYYFHDGAEMVSGIANFNGTGTAKRDGAGGPFTQAKMSGTVTGGILQGQYFTGKVKATLDNVQ